MKANNKKIIITFALALLILAGIVVVLLKGFNVSLSVRAHDTLKFVFEQKFEKADIENVCNEVFGEQEYQIKTVEVFTDAVYIMSPTITDEQKDNLLSKLDDLYKVKEENNEENQEENANGILEGIDYNFYTDAKVRIRDIVKPYIMPSVISALIILIYIAVKYRKLNNGKVYITIFETLVQMAVVILALLSILAITRIPFQVTVVPILIFLVLIFIVIKLAVLEGKLHNVEE